MDTFLKQIARRIVTDHPMDTDEVLVVFNNNRSKRFFNSQFRSLGRATFLPKVMAIDEFISELSGLEIVPNEFLLFELYHIHESIGGEGRKYQSFEDFISFGDLMMGDFSEIDQYCVDAKKIFDNLHNLKAIGEWNIESGQLSDFQRKYLDFYRSLYDYYSQLHERLLAQGKAYSGMAYREVAEKIGAIADSCPYSAIYFVGFNALSKCEELIIGEYVQRGVGHLLADSDIYYLEHDQEAGYFLKKHMDNFPELRPTGSSHFETCRKKITIVDCPENILQCKYAGQLLSEHPDWLNPTEAESTAVVLADEKLLIPTLNALPENNRNYSVNITMGYSYSDSMVHAMVGKLFSLYRQRTDKGYYHSDVVEVMSDRFIGQLLSVVNLRHITETFLRRDNRIRCHADDLHAILQHAGAINPEAVLILFPDQKPTPAGCLHILRQLASSIVNSGILEKNRKEKQALGSLAEVLDNLNKLMETYPVYIANTETLEKIYSRLASHHSISLYGEPLTGLQILGMLETRNLDFKRVILLSTNEGVLPSGRNENTLIPNELKIHFGLPTYIEKDSVYAYHFYRLLQRAEDIYLVYSSESESMGKGEASRFIRQVECELAPRFGIETIHQVVAADPLLTSITKEHETVKTEAVMKRLVEMGQRCLSPTSFYDYIECPLKYYYSRVLNINELEELDEDLDSAQLGDCIHKVLENIFRPQLGQSLHYNYLRDALDRLPSLMEECFEELYSNGRNSEGRNRFLYSVAETQLRHTLEREADALQRGNTLTVLAVEEKIEDYPIAEGVNLKGKVDRVDLFNGCLRIIDYKTGRVEKKEITYHDGDTLMPGKWMQLMWYALLYCHKHHPGGIVKSGISPLRNLRSGVMTASWESSDWDDSETITPEKLNRFESLLREKTDELMNPSVPFLPVPTKAACRFCPAKNFCHYSIQ